MNATIFDIDGTLLQSDANDDALYLASVREVLGDVNLRPSWGMYTQFTAAGILAEILNDNAIAATAERVAAVRDRFIESTHRHVSEHGPFAEIPGARAFVQILHNSTTHQIAYDHFDRREIMLHALRQLNGIFDTVTYYGDGHWDAVAAKALGWRFVPVGTKLNGISRYEPSVA